MLPSVLVDAAAAVVVGLQAAVGDVVVAVDLAVVFVVAEKVQILVLQTLYFETETFQSHHRMASQIFCILQMDPWSLLHQNGPLNESEKEEIPRPHQVLNALQILDDA